MEKNNPNTKDKKEKVGPDGLTKKERRALKVTEKGKGEPPIVNNTTAPQSAINNKSEKSIVSTAEPVVKELSKKERRTLKVAEKANEKPVEAKAVNTQLPADIKKPEIRDNEATTEGKSKAQMRAERRELQEKQRQAKLVAKDPVKEVKQPVINVQKSPKVEKLVKKEPAGVNQVQLFNHLYMKPLSKEKVVIHKVHPTFIKLGAQYASKTILGSNARCLALLSALKDLIEDFVTPPKQELCRSLETYLQASVNYIQKCRPFAVSMTNALRHFKVHSTQIRTDLSDEEKKSQLIQIVDIYIEDEIHTAGQAISNKVSEKIVDNDVILTYGCSSLIKKILVDAKNQGKTFRVIIVDGRPLLEGREMLRKLISAGIDCTYVLINAVSFIMSQATKVLFGAHSLLANGYVMARTGTAQVALIAQSYNKPVLVCCETYKFSERVQTDSFVYNEIGDPDKILKLNTNLSENPLEKSPKNNITPLNLMYDVTPPDLVTAVVTELAILPCTSVPVILRIKPTE